MCDQIGAPLRTRRLGNLDDRNWRLRPAVAPRRAAGFGLISAGSRAFNAADAITPPAPHDRPAPPPATFPRVRAIFRVRRAEESFAAGVGQGSEAGHEVPPAFFSDFGAGGLKGFQAGIDFRHPGPPSPAAAGRSRVSTGPRGRYRIALAEGSPWQPLAWDTSDQGSRPEGAGQTPVCNATGRSPCVPRFQRSRIIWIKPQAFGLGYRVPARWAEMIRRQMAKGRFQPSRGSRQMARGLSQPSRGSCQMARGHFQPSRGSWQMTT